MQQISLVQREIYSFLSLSSYHLCDDSRHDLRLGGRVQWRQPGTGCNRGERSSYEDDDYHL